MKEHILPIIGLEEVAPITRGVGGGLVMAIVIFNDDTTIRGSGRGWSNGGFYLMALIFANGTWS